MANYGTSVPEKGLLVEVRPEEVIQVRCSRQDLVWSASEYCKGLLLRGASNCPSASKYLLLHVLGGTLLL